MAYAAQDLSVNRVGIFPTRRIERGQKAGQIGARIRRRWGSAWDESGWRPSGKAAGV
ncbi:hypothetical protein EMIT0158MI4_120054 [Burkholderia ambifaria]